MNRLLVLLACIPVGARAETFELSASGVMRERPVRAKRSCTAENAHWQVEKAMPIGKAAVELLHACGDVSISSGLAARIDDQWFLVVGTTIAERAANMTDTPLEISLVGESLERGTFEDGSDAIVYRAVTRHDSVRRCLKAKSRASCVDHVVESHLRSHVLVCTMKDDWLVCGRIDYRCPSSGCGRADFKRGQLVVIEEHVYVPSN